MQIKHLYILAFSLSLFLSCTKEKKSTHKITNNKDYEQYITSSNQQLVTEKKHNLSFWKTKLAKTPNQYPYQSKIAAVTSNLFAVSGNISFLKEAEKNLIAVNKKNTTAGSLRALARNYISQHKFQESLILLKKAELNGQELNATQKMLFDVYLELGNYKQAEKYLSLIKKPNEFDYLIRASKWNDTNGDLQNAILSLEKALKIAESSKNKNLILWSYTNIADFYGHNNEIEKSYSFYLKALKIDPNNTYAKKGIAWIIYSYEKNPKEALRIINSIQKEHSSPDYYLLKAEIAEFMNNLTIKNENLNLYLLTVKNKLYGDMYNQYNAKLFLEEFDKKDKALVIIKKEIKNRPTPQSYDLLAWYYFQNKNYKKALKIVNTNVVGKCYEPEVVYHIAEIYKANNLQKEANNLKKELLESSYELGPMMKKRIYKL
mgnify:CR=1 FL=1